MLGYFSSVKKQIEKQKKKDVKNNQQNKYEYVHIVSYLNKKKLMLESYYPSKITRINHLVGAVVFLLIGQQKPSVFVISFCTRYR
jgi:hypothetical protein